ncbi:MAG: thioredoxin [Chloroflexi bacterium]|nr:thioredoxin [Chloroflexota bacterium]
MAAELPEMTAEAFEAEVLQSDLPVLIDFTAEWCAPCKMLDPIVAELAQEWEGKVKVFQMDADKNTDLLVQWRIMGVPTLALFKDGKIVARMTGYKPKKSIIKKFGKHLSL